MQSKKIRKRGLQPLKRYQGGGVTPCPNPPCPPDNETGNAAQLLVDSGAWMLTPDNRLVRRDATEVAMPVPGETRLLPGVYPTDQGVIKPEPAGVPPNAAWMYQSMPAFQNPEGMQAAAKWTEENPLSSPQGLNLVGMLNAMGMKALALPVPGTAHIAGGLTVGDVFNAYFLKEGIQGLREDIPEFQQNPSWGGAGNIGIDVLQTLPGAAGLYQNVAKPSAELMRAWRNYIGPFVQDAETIDLGEAMIMGEQAIAPQTAGFTDPVKEIIGKGVKTTKDAMSVVKRPPLPIMEEARIEASIQGVREYFGMELGNDYIGETMTPEKMRQLAIKQLVGPNPNPGQLERANQAIDEAIESSMPQAIETVMRRSEGNILNIPVDTRHPQLDRVRMRFLGPNSKLWQQANKEGLIPVTNVKQAMSNMSEMEKAVLEEAIFSAPVYNKKGVLLQGEELRNAQDAIISAVARPGMGPSIEESAEGIGDISGYRINLNQLKGLTETTSYTSSPVRTMGYVQGTENYFGSKVDPMIFDSKQAGTAQANSWSDYGLDRIGYGFDNPVRSRTFIIGSDNYQTNISHFKRGELSHFRTFTNDRPKPIAKSVQGMSRYMSIDFNQRYNQIRYGQGLRPNIGTMEWHPDMSRVPSGLGISRGGNFTPNPNLGKNAIKIALEPENYGLTHVSGATNAFLNEVQDARTYARTLINEAERMQDYGKPLVEAEDMYKAVYEFAKRPDMVDIIKANVPDPKDQDLLIGYLDNFAEAGKKEANSFYRLKNPGSPFDEVEQIPKLGTQQEALSTTLDAIDQSGLTGNIVSKSNPYYMLQNTDGMRTSGMWDTIYNSSLQDTDGDPGWWSDMTSDLHNSLETYYGVPGGDIGAVMTLKERFLRELADRRVNLKSRIRPKSPEFASQNAVYSEQVERIKDYEKEIEVSLNTFYSLTQDAYMSSDFLQNARKTIYDRLIKTNTDPSISMNQLYKQSVEEVERRHPYHIRDLKGKLAEMNDALHEGRRISNTYGEILKETGEPMRGNITNEVNGSINEITEQMNSALQQPGLNSYYEVLESENQMHTHLSSIRTLLEDIDDVPGLSQPIKGPVNNEKNRYYVSEIQSDFVQMANEEGTNIIPTATDGSHNTASVYSTDRLTKKGSDPTLDSFAKNWRVKTIQQAVLQGRKAGKTEILFPTYETADKIQAWSGSKDTGVVGSGNRITYQSMNKHIQKATGIKPSKVKDSKGNEWWMIKVDPDQKYEFPDFKQGGIIRLKKK